MKILIADEFEQSGLSKLQELGCQVVVNPQLSGESLAAAIRENNPDVLVVRSTKVDAAVIEAGRTLGLIIRAGSGVNTIDLGAAGERGVYVANCPGTNAVAVAELVFGLMISLDRRIAHNINDLREGAWNKEEYSKARGLKGGTLGIVGLGAVGKALARRALAFEMRVVYYDVTQHVEFEQKYGIERQPLDDLLKQSDWVSLHVPFDDTTHHLINESRLRLMKPSAHLINTSRAQVVDHRALATALREGRLAGAGLDVYEQEPPTARGVIDDPLIHLKELYGTHHIGASTEQAQEAVADETVRIIKAYMETGDVPNCVNIEKEDHAGHVLVVRHHNRVGVLAAVCSQLGDAGVNILDMRNTVLSGGKTCCARIRLNNVPPPATLDAIRSHEAILAVMLL